MRLLGVLAGSALAVGALVVFVGIPEFTTEESVAENTIITLPMRQASRSDSVPGSHTDPGPETRPQSIVEPDSSPPASATETVAADTTDSPGAEIPSPPPQPETLPEQPADLPAESQVADEPRQWYAFWSPFRSEIAASGFVDQLQRVTGLDYRVVKVKTGVYEVAFAYADDDEINASLSQITAATGLQMPEGQ